MKNTYPIGATWEAVTESKRIGKIWLSRHEGNIEVWKYSVYERDGSYSPLSSDWGASYAVCRKNIPLWNKSGKRIIFKRII